MPAIAALSRRWSPVSPWPRVGRAELELEQPAFRGVFGDIPRVESTGLWFEAGALLSPAAPPNALVGPIEPLALYSTDLLAEERVRMARGARGGRSVGDGGREIVTPKTNRRETACFLPSFPPACRCRSSTQRTVWVR